MVVRKLSPELFYPDCAGCGTNLYVSRATGHDNTFKCQRCGYTWVDVEFEAVFTLSQKDMRLYILHRHGGYAFCELDRQYKSSRATEAEYIRIRKRIRRRIGGPIPAVGTYETAEGVAQ